MTKTTIKTILLSTLGICLTLGGSALAQTSKPNPEIQTTRRDGRKGKTKQLQFSAMIATWREQSTLYRQSDGDHEINTLNSVARLGINHQFYRSRIYARYLFLIGQSANQNTDASVTFFQRSAMLTGFEMAYGFSLLKSHEIEMGFSAGGLVRQINHSIPDSSYKFKTAQRALPLLTFDFTWRLSEMVFVRQNVGTTGQKGDTFWSAGFSFTW